MRAVSCQLDPVVGAMLAAGWTDAQIGAALRAAFSESGHRFRASNARDKQPAAFSESGHRFRASNARDKQPAAFSESATVETVETVGFQRDGRMRAWADPKALAAKRDPMLARAAFEIAPGLTHGHRAVGIALAARFFNAKTGRCDPSTGALARAAGVSRATAFRALNRLEDARLLRRASYGGAGHANAYAFDFEVCAEAVSSWQQSQSETVEAQPSQKPSQNATQTQRYIYNNFPHSERVRARPKRKTGRVPIEGQLELVGPTLAISNRKPASSEPRTHNHPLMVPQPLLRLVPNDIPSIKAAGRLWTDWAHAFPGGVARAFAGASGLSQTAFLAGAKAERQRAGEGLAAMRAAIDHELEGLRASARDATGPP